MGERTGCVPHHLASLSRGTCWVLPSSSGWHGQGCQRTPFMPGVPHRPPQPYTHTPAAYTRRQESGVGSWLGLGQGGGGDTEPATLSRHSGGHGAWLGLAGRDRQVSVGLGALVAVKSSAGVRGQCRRECKVQVFSLGPSTLLQPKGTRTAATPRNLSYSQESPKPGPLSKQPGMSSSVLGQKEP